MADHFGKDTPKLGFGLMRLPRVALVTDIEQTKQMVDLFMNAGFITADLFWHGNRLHQFTAAVVYFHFLWIVYIFNYHPSLGTIENTLSVR